MTAPRLAGRSPRIPDSTLARHPAATRPPGEHTHAELACLLRLLREAGADTISVGHGRDPASTAAAQAMAEVWTSAGGTVLTVVHWPADAASWLRPARRLTDGDPDAWVLADTPAGCAQLARRLADRPNWTPARTFGFAGLAGPDLVALAGPTVLAGMTGATAGGGSWRVEPGVLVLPSP